MIEVQRHERPTIMDGKVIDFSPSFEMKPGVFGDRAEATGCFHISASRNAVIVHKAELRNERELSAFTDALMQARRAAHNLSNADRGNYNA